MFLFPAECCTLILFVWSYPVHEEHVYKKKKKKKKKKKLKYITQYKDSVVMSYHGPIIITKYLKINVLNQSVDLDF